jgi:hypothetical protein
VPPGKGIALNQELVGSGSFAPILARSRHVRLGRVLIKSRLISTFWTMSAIRRFADLNRTSAQVRKLPIPDSWTATDDKIYHHGCLGRKLLPLSTPGATLAGPPIAAMRDAGRIMPVPLMLGPFVVATVGA